MSCFDCSKAVPEICKADCCGIVPIDNVVWKSNQEKIITSPLEVLEMDVEDFKVVFPITQSANCCFLTEDYKCNIYNLRPKICREFGAHPKLQCPHLNYRGEFRTESERLVVTREMEIFQKNIFNKLKEDEKAGI